MDIQTIGLGQASPPEVRGNVAARKPSPPAREPQVESQAEPQVRAKATLATAPTPQQLQQVVDNINSKLSDTTALQFSVDEGSGRTVVKVTDKDTGETIRQIPSEAVLALAESIGEFQKGMLLQQKA
jgi:flagellar protein FlaG